MAPRKRTASGNPLTGLRILVTRAAPQASALSDRLRRLGAQIVSIPVIKIVPPKTLRSLDSVLRRIHEFDWLILTSVNGVARLFARMKKLKISPRTLRPLKIAAIGPATRDAVERHGLRVAVMPREYVAEAVVRSLRAKVKGKRVLLVRAAEARDVIPRELRRAGARVEIVAAYETKLPREARGRIARLLRTAPPDVVTFTSSSTARNFLRSLTAATRRDIAKLSVAFASIGPVTTRTLGEHGFRAPIQATEYTMPGLAAAIRRWARSKR